MARITRISGSDNTEAMAKISSDGASCVEAVISLDDGATNNGVTNRKANSGSHSVCCGALSDDEAPTTGIPDWAKRAMTHLDDTRGTKADFASDGGTIKPGDGYHSRNERVDGRPNIPSRHTRYDDGVDDEFLVIKVPVLVWIATIFFAWMQRLTR